MSALYYYVFKMKSICQNLFTDFPVCVQGDIFSGLNDGLLSRAEALAAVDIGKHQSGPQSGPPLPQLKHDMVYHHGVGAPPPHNPRPHQVHCSPYL